MTYTLAIAFNGTSLVNTLAGLSREEVAATVEKLGRQRKRVTFSVVEE